MGLQTKQGPAKITMVPQVFQQGLPGFIPLEIVMFRCPMVLFIPSQKMDKSSTQHLHPQTFLETQEKPPLGNWSNPHS